MVATRTNHFLCKKCFEKFSDLERRQIRKNFNGLGTKMAQDIMPTFLLVQTGIRQSAVKRQRVYSTTHKSTSYHYFITKGRDEVSVYRKAFSNLLGGKECRIKRLAKLKSEGTMPTDGWGKHHNRPNAYIEEKINLIENHIKSFPKYQTNYNSKITYYLSSDLSVNKMHSLFLEKHFPLWKW